VLAPGVTAEGVSGNARFACQIGRKCYRMDLPDIQFIERKEKDNEYNNYNVPTHIGTI